WVSFPGFVPRVRGAASWGWMPPALLSGLPAWSGASRRHRLGGIYVSETNRKVSYQIESVARLRHNLSQARRHQAKAAGHTTRTWPPGVRAGPDPHEGGRGGAPARPARANG